MSEIDWETPTKVALLTAASYLTEPLCKVREYFYTFYTLSESSRLTIQKVARIAQLIFGIIICSFLTPLTTPAGIALRGLVSTFESNPFIYIENSDQGKQLPSNRQITLVSHNECYMPAGYSITDGQVTPPSDRERVDRNIKTIKQLDPDVICLQEVPDICDASYISSQLSQYPFLIPVAGVRAIGPSSMMYIASKYEIVASSIKFVPFLKGTELTGRAQYSEKGFLSFDLKSRGENGAFVTVISTHLQHSEVPQKPEETDKISRNAQMRKIARHIEEKIKQGIPSVIFTGDLNQEEKELNDFLSSNKINWLRRDVGVEGRVTWGGDEWCSRLMKKPASGPLVLDYTFVAGKVADIATKILGTGYSSPMFSSSATSDHSLLFSTITVE